MITLYPLLVSNTISKNIVPGVCKVLENYIMVYGLADMLKRIRTSPRAGGDWSVISKKVVKRENVDVDLSTLLYNEIIQEGSRIYGQTGAGTKGSQAGTSGGSAPETSTKDKTANVSITPYNMQSISLEPTWMKIDQVDKKGNKISGIIGVKVVPYAVKSDAKLSQLLMYDNQVNMLQRLAILTGRRITNGLYKIWTKMWTSIPFVSKSTAVTGDPRKDILLKRNMLNINSVQDIFIIANQAELSDTFYSSAKGMIKLQKMGWGSIIIADDVNRRVAFCMKDLHGICSMIPYTMLYQTFSQAKVYEDIEDAKRNASSIFKVSRKKMSKLIGESVAYKKTEQYGTNNLPICESEFISELKLIDENIATFVKKMSPDKLKTTLFNVISGKFTGIPKVTNDKLLKYGMKLNPQFKTGYELARKVIGNSSPELSENMTNLGANVVCVRSLLTSSSDKFMEGVKNGLKLIIRLFRKIKPKPNSDKPTMPRAHMMDAVFGWIGITMMLVAVIKISPYVNKVVTFISKYVSMTYKWIRDVNVTVAEAKETANEIVDNTMTSIKDYYVSSAPSVILCLLIVGAIWYIIKGKK